MRVRPPVGTKHDADERLQPDGSATGGSPIALIAATIVGLMPLYFGLSTWEHIYSSTDNRIYGVPLLISQLVLIGVALFSAFAKRRRTIPYNPLIALPLVALCILSMVVGVTYAGTEIAIVRALINPILLATVASVALLARNHENFGGYVLRGLTLGIAAFELACFFALLLHPDLTLLDLKRVGFGVTHVRQLAFYGSLGCALALGLSLFARQRVEQLGWLLVASLGLAFIMWSGSRGGLFALGGLLCIAPFTGLGWSRLKRLYIGMAAIVPIGAALSIIWVPDNGMWGLSRILGLVVAQAGDPNVHTITSNRTLMWLESIELIRERPLFGYGEGQFRFIAETAYGYYAHPHNFIMQFMVSWGLIGFLLAAIPMAAALFIARGRVAAHAPIVLPALFGALVLLAYALIDSTLYQYFPLVSFLMLLAVACNAGEPAGHQGSRREESP